MTELDQALEKYIHDDTQQDQYYTLVLKSEFYLPVLDDDSVPDGEEESVTPLVVHSDGKKFLMLFDSEERLISWAKQPTRYMRMTGAGLAQISPAAMYWAVNVGSKYAKEFVPDEISWITKSPN
jgi:hypothetical protein